MKKLEYVPFIATEDFFSYLDEFCSVFENPQFDEFTPRTYGQPGLFVRIQKGLQEGDPCRAYIEPQINLSRSVKDEALVYKVQVTVVKDYPRSYGRLVPLEKIETVISGKQFIKDVLACPGHAYMLERIMPEPLSLFPQTSN